MLTTEAISYWEPSGLAEIARLLNQAIDLDLSQNALAERIEVSASTLRNLRKNEHGYIVSVPDPLTLKKLAPYLTNPHTGRAYTPEEVIDIASSPQPTGETFKSYVKKKCDHNGIPLAELAASLEVTRAKLNEVLSKPEALSREEKLLWLVLLDGKIGGSSFLAKLMGLDVSGCVETL